MRSNRELLTAVDFRRMIDGANSAFLQQYERINSLNVFPVPDGDTGTNLLLTLGAIRQALVGPVGDAGIGQISRRAADSAIMGARGNSGVILAQIFRGFARGLAGKEVATSSEIGKAFQYGILYAYRAVARPVEGTILTVAKGIAKGTRRAVRENLSFADILRRAVKTGRTELARTPELLPALKQAGVVDAGGLGLITLLEGCLTGLEGRYRSPEADFETILTLPESAGEITLSHPYCTEFLVKNAAVNAKEARRQLESLGDSLIVAATEEAVKVHIHTARPGSVLEIGLAWGSLHDVKIDNMADQHRSSPQATGRQTGLAVISVSPGPGLSEIMRKMGRAIIIDGGQTMNPPVEDFVNAVHGGSAEQYIILPNNANIILAATQAQKLLGNRVAVVPTRNVPQGLAALVAFDPQVDLTDNAARMSQRVAAVRAAGLTCAVRSCEIDGVKVRAGQYIGVADDKTVTAGDDLAAVLGDVIRMLVGTDTELISLYYGTTLSSEKAAALAAEITAVFPDIELELYDGGQPHYLFLIGTE